MNALFFLINYAKKLSKRPAATALPITPATLGPIACMSKWFDGSYSSPITSDTRASGTADTPVLPIKGLILFSGF